MSETNETPERVHLVGGPFELNGTIRTDVREAVEAARRAGLKGGLFVVDDEQALPDRGPAEPQPRAHYSLPGPPGSTNTWGFRGWVPSAPSDLTPTQYYLHYGNGEPLF
ncbi:MAG: hypothetical protein M0026_09105 [Nocardiopsaceae bacterium]|nr:hypothetical protein [Nocardiopsaceae bacterium]